MKNFREEVLGSLRQSKSEKRTVGINMWWRPMADAFTSLTKRIYIGDVGTNLYVFENEIYELGHDNGYQFLFYRGAMGDLTTRDK